MSDQDNKAQPGQLLTELEEAKQKLADLRKQTASKMEHLDPGIQHLLQEALNRHPSERDFNPEFDLVNYLKQEHSALPGYTDLLTMVDALKSARQRVYELEEKKAQIQGSPKTFSV
jgi:hypothetical protein